MGLPAAYEDMERADVVLLIGANLADNHPILCQYLEANRNKTLIVADPRVSKTAMMAEHPSSAQTTFGPCTAQRHRPHSHPL